MKLLFITLIGIAAVTGQQVTKTVTTHTTTGGQTTYQIPGKTVTTHTSTTGGQTFQTSPGKTVIITKTIHEKEEEERQRLANLNINLNVQNQNNGRFGNDGSGGNGGNGGNQGGNEGAEGSCIKLHGRCNAVAAVNLFAKAQCCTPLHCQLSIFEGIFWPTFACTSLANKLGMAN